MSESDVLDPEDDYDEEFYSQEDDSESEEMSTKLSESALPDNGIQLKPSDEASAMAERPEINQRRKEVEPAEDKPVPFSARTVDDILQEADQVLEDERKFYMARYEEVKAEKQKLQREYLGVKSAAEESQRRADSLAKEREILVEQVERLKLALNQADDDADNLRDELRAKEEQLREESTNNQAALADVSAKLDNVQRRLAQRTSTSDETLAAIEQRFRATRAEYERHIAELSVRLDKPTRSVASQTTSTTTGGGGGGGSGAFHRTAADSRCCTCGCVPPPAERSVAFDRPGKVANDNRCGGLPPAPSVTNCSVDGLIALDGKGRMAGSGVCGCCGRSNVVSGADDEVRLERKNTVQLLQMRTELAQIVRALETIYSSMHPSEDA